MPTVVGILICISIINTTPKELDWRKSLHFQHFSYYGQFKFHAQLSMKKGLDFTWSTFLAIVTTDFSYFKQDFK